MRADSNSIPQMSLALIGNSQRAMSRLKRHVYCLGFSINAIDLWGPIRKYSISGYAVIRPLD
jgi:hypothetical protein